VSQNGGDAEGAQRHISYEPDRRSNHSRKKRPLHILDLIICMHSTRNIDSPKCDLTCGILTVI
jgi:hypothetical protein